MLVMVLGALPLAAWAQTFEVLPEIDAYYRFNPNLRIYFQAKDTREGGEQNSAEIGPSLDFHIKVLSELAEIAKFDLDGSKSQLLLFSVGYRYLPYPNAPPTNRFEPYFVVNVPARGRLFISDRNRADLDWSNGKFFTTVTASMWNDQGRSRGTTCRLMPARSSGTRANTGNGARRRCLPGVFFRSANMSGSIRTTSTRTTQEKPRTSK